LKTPAKRIRVAAYLPPRVYEQLEKERGTIPLSTMMVNILATYVDIMAEDEHQIKMTK
jgi:hypothetical protein